MDNPILTEFPTTITEYFEQKKARYKALCEYRDSVNARIAPLKKKLAEKSAIAENARVEAVKIADEISQARGGQAWFMIKKEIGLLARELGGK